MRSTPKTAPRHRSNVLLAGFAALALSVTVSPLALLATGVVTVQAAEELGLVISPDQAAALIGQPNVKLVDVRPQVDYVAGHIPGAISLPWQRLSVSEEAGVRNEFAADDVLAREFGLAGLSYDDTIILYDGSALAGRGYVTFEYAGFPNLHVLDGGIVGWAGELSTEAATPVQTAFALDRKEEIRVNAAFVADQVGREDAVIIDGRSLEAFADGHIPTAVGIPSGVYVNAEAGLRPREELLAELAAQGVTPNKRIVAYCGSGVAAANTYLALRQLGFTNIVLYDASWDDWSRDPRQNQEISLPNYTVDVAALGNAETGPQLLSADQVKDLQAAGNVVVLDVRSPSDYGAGKIPGSVNVYWNATLDQDRVLKSRDELLALYAAQGITPDKHVVIFTRGGLQLTHTYTVLSILGFDNIDLFTGAYEGWDNASFRRL